jgi:demethylmenaquinone methyltransferase/2-methoxy-6-polyprenyl-1,4-benzoquinol methylase
MTEPSRKEIWNMFNALSRTYDQTNRWMTLGLDLYWRKKVGSFLPRGKDLTLLDCATGTADQILSLMRHRSQIKHAIGIDLAEGMLAIGNKKISQTPFHKQINLQKASILDIPFPQDRFDCVTLSFGIRNVTHVSNCLMEIFRVLKPGGKLLILETSIPKNRMLRNLHLWYLRNILPKVGGIISKQKHAYDYLNQTAETFPSGDRFCDLLTEVGFKSVKQHPLSGGVVSIYEAAKPL